MLVIRTEGEPMLAEIQNFEHAARLAMGSLEPSDPVERPRIAAFTAWAAAFAVAVAASVSGVWLL